MEGGGALVLVSTLPDRTLNECGPDPSQVAAFRIRGRVWMKYLVHIIGLSITTTMYGIPRYGISVGRAMQPFNNH